MPAILSIETSTSICSVAIHKEGRLIASSEIHEEQAHASRLAVLIQNLTKALEIPLNTLQAVAISSGPGSYTGLRIGISTAKGLCYALGVPLIAVDALKLMALKVEKLGITNGLLCPMLDARRAEVYYGIFGRELRYVESIQSVILDENAFKSFLDDGAVSFFGTGMLKAEKIIKHVNARFIHNILPSAIELGELATQKLKEGQHEDLTTFEPLYLKEFLVKKPTKIHGVLNK
jgi:tRNA threonylcarbamoyladenosine biosynthesis protein TsaB